MILSRLQLRPWAAAFVLAFTGFSGNSAIAQSSGEPQQSVGGAVFTPQVLRTIDVRGNQRIEDDTVRSYMAIKVGDQITAPQVDLSLKTLFNTGLFADIAIGQDGGRLIVEVVENPIVNRVAFEGNIEFQNENLQAETQLRPRVLFTRAKAQSDVQRILDLYRREGRFAATVEPKIIQLDQNRIDVVFEITEGPVTKIKKINFIGNKIYSDGGLRSEISSSESGWYTYFFSTSDNYDPDRLAFDREQLRRFYLSRGYADFQVLSAVAELTRTRDAFFITFTVEEGEQYTFGELDVRTGLSELDPEKLQSLIGVSTGDTYDADAVEKIIDDITFAAGEFGYAFVEVRPVVRKNREELTIDLTFDVREGPRVYVERIDIEGNLRTLDKVIRRQFRVAEGDAFNRVKIDRARRNLRGLGFFSDIQITEEPGSTPDSTIVKVQVQEQSTGELSIGLGFSTDSPVAGDVSLTERNLLGRGQFLRMRVAFSSQQKEFELRFTEPYFLGRNISAGFDLFRTETEFQNESSFDQRSTGGGIRFGFPLAENLRLSTRYRISYDEVRDVPTSASPFIIAVQDDYLASIVGFTLSYDLRNDPIDPTAGFSASLDQDVAGLGGNVRFARTIARASVFTEFTEGFVASSRVEVGGILDFAGYETTVLDRFFVGGSQLRGFKRSGIGPRDRNTGDALGGNFFAVLRNELTIPIPVVDEVGIRPSIFADVGTLFDLDESVANSIVDDKRSLRASVGIGVSWNSPLGPIRLDFSEALIKEGFDKTEFFRFSAGTRF